jgi:membrane fusion protein (multidrug efflux system)
MTRLSSMTTAITLRAPFAVLLALVWASASACSKDAGGSPAAGPGAAGPGAAGAQGPGRPGARPAPTITLATSDVATVVPTTLEDGVALTGDLHPIETIDVRSRIEGDLTGVYVREGQQVSAGQLLARFEASEQESGRASAEADRVAASADLSNATWTLEQNAQLFKAGGIAERDYKVSQQAVISARARLAAAEARLRASGNQARDTRVVAPASGIVEKRLVSDGERVSKGTPLFSIVRNGTLELAAAVPSRQASVVRVGQLVRFTAEGRQFNGSVARLSPTIDPATRAVTVYVEVPNPGGLLRGGTFATGRVVARTLNNVLAVPTAALRQSQQGDGKPFVYRLDGRTVNSAPVQLGAVDERLGLAQVTDGLQAGDRVIVGNVGILGRGMTAIIQGEEQGRRRP